MQGKENKVKSNMNFIAITVGWAITVASFIWAIASKDADYSYRIERIELELVELDERLDVAESFRMEIRTALAQIQTDLIWIRKELASD